MGRLRSAAKRLALFTERHTPNPTQRWASAVAHEIDHIEGEWHSLGWALGGLRLLVLHGFVPTPTPARLERLAVLHGRARRQSVQRSIASRILTRANILFSSLLFLYMLHRYYPAHSLTASGLILFCAGFLRPLLSGLRQPSVAIPDEDDTRALLTLYKLDLRQSTQVSSFLSFILPALASFAGTELLAPTLWVRVLGYIWFLVILLYVQQNRANRVTLDALQSAS